MALVKEFIKLDRKIVSSNQDETKGFYIINPEEKLLQINTIPQSKMNLPIDEIKSYSQTILFDENGLKKLLDLIMPLFSSSPICRMYPSAKSR